MSPCHRKADLSLGTMGAVQRKGRAKSGMKRWLLPQVPEIILLSIAIRTGGQGWEWDEGSLLQSWQAKGTEVGRGLKLDDWGPPAMEGSPTLSQ